MVNLRKVGAIALLGVLIAGFSEQSKAQSQAQRISPLPNGNYRFCQQEAEYLDSGFGESYEVCFLFRKVGSSVIGEYFVGVRGSEESNSICIAGRANGNTITGQGLMSIVVEPNLDPIRVPLQTRYFQTWTETWDGRHSGSTLAVRQGTWAGSFIESSLWDEYGEDRRDWIQYNSIELNLNGYQRMNAGTTLPPSDCRVSSEGRPMTPRRPY